jgi:hypothetical protein
MTTACLTKKSSLLIIMSIKLEALNTVDTRIKVM